MRRHLSLTFLTLLAACGSAAVPASAPDGLEVGDAPDAAIAAPTDAGTPPDAGGPGEAGLEVRDWREVRGAPLQTTTLSRATGSLYAARRDGFVWQDACSGPRCTWSWLRLDGTAERRFEAMPVHRRAPLSNDARHLLLFEVAAQRTCGGEYDELDGTVSMSSIETGAVELERQNTRTSYEDEPAFLPSSRWLHLFAPATPCGQPEDEYLEVAPPHAASAMTGAFAEQERPDGRFVAFRYRADLGTVDPHTGAFRSLAADPQGLAESGGWLHAFDGWPLRTVESEDAAGGRHRRAFSSAEEWYGAMAGGSYVVVCGRADAATRTKSCRAIDLRGQAPDRDFRVSAPATRRLVVAWRRDALVYVDRTASGQEVRSLDLRSGDSTRLAPGDAVLYGLGDGAAVLLASDRHAELVEGTERTVLADDLATVVTHEEVPTAGALPQNDLTLLVRLRDGEFALDALQYSKRRLTRLAERLRWAPYPGSPIAQDRCTAPWVTRTGGDAWHHLVSAGSYLFFLATDDRAQEPGLYVAPVDLSAPPRLLTRTGEPGCHRPLASVDASRLAVQIDLAGGQREVRTAEWR